MPTYADDKVEAIAGGAIHDPYVTRDGDVAAPAFVSFQRGGPAVLKGTGPATLTAVGCVSDSAEALPLATQKLHSFRAEGVEKAYVRSDGAFVGPGGAAFGSANESNESGSNIVMSGGTSHQWITGTVGPISGAPLVTWDNSNKWLVVGADGAGTYFAAASGAGTLSAGDDIESAIWVNEAESILRVDQAVATQAAYQPFAVSGLLTLAVGDYVSLRMSTGSTTRTWAMRHAQFSIFRVG